MSENHSTKSDVQKIPLGSIRKDNSLQMRADMDQSAIRDYTAMLMDDEQFEFDPVVVFKIESTSVYLLAHGWHRHKAYQKAGRKTIPAVVIVGTKRDALRLALSANAKNGLRRSNADKRKAVEHALADPEWSQLSARKVAKLCGVTHTFVNKLIEERELGRKEPTDSIQTHRGNGFQSSVRKQSREEIPPNNEEAVAILEGLLEHWDEMEDGQRYQAVRDALNSL